MPCATPCPACKPGELPILFTRYTAAFSGDPLTEGRQLALLRMQALGTHGARATASGNLRGLGFITRIDDNAGRKDPRGEGFELRTDGHGAIRANDGLLITTEGRASAAKHAKDMDETIVRLKSAQEQHEGLAQAASTAKAQSNGQDQGAVAKAIEAQNDAIQGKGLPDRDKAVFPELSGAHLVLASAAGVAATTAQSMHLQAASTWPSPARPTPA